LECEEDIRNFNDKLNVSLASFFLPNKLKVGVRTHLNTVTHLIKCACDGADDNAGFQISFELV
jgi:hypothetical protein